jgi:hypothetical protein
MNSIRVNPARLVYVLRIINNREFKQWCAKKNKPFNPTLGKVSANSVRWFSEKPAHPLDPFTSMVAPTAFWGEGAARRQTSTGWSPMRCRASCSTARTHNGVKLTPAGVSKGFESPGGGGKE